MKHLRLGHTGFILSALMTFALAGCYPPFRERIDTPTEASVDVSPYTGVWEMSNTSYNSFESGNRSVITMTKQADSVVYVDAHVVDTDTPSGIQLSSTITLTQVGNDVYALIKDPFVDPEDTDHWWHIAKIDLVGNSNFTMSLVKTSAMTEAITTSQVSGIIGGMHPVGQEIYINADGPTIRDFLSNHDVFSGGAEIFFLRQSNGGNATSSSLNTNKGLPLGEVAAAHVSETPWLPAGLVLDLTGLLIIITLGSKWRTRS